MTTSLNTSSLRTSTRQTRTNPTRVSKTNGRPLGLTSLGTATQGPGLGANEPHGFYPAITHFTDAITALPREFRRHTSLLKEVEAKSSAAAEALQHRLAAASASKPVGPPPQAVPSAAGSTTDHAETQTQTGTDNVSAPPSIVENVSQTSALPFDSAAFFARQKIFYDLRQTLIDMVVTMDERNHVITNANDELSRRLDRVKEIYPHVEGEISEEARLGSLSHWAYSEKPMGKTTGVVERSRREAAAVSLAVMHDADAAARSESRREAMLARKQRHNHVDSDFDDGRALPKRLVGAGKAKRIGEVAAESALGLGIAGSLPAPAKRRRVEKPTIGGTTMDRSLSGALVGGRAMSRENSNHEPVKKRTRAPNAASTSTRKRTNPSGAMSPSLASSPVVANFAAPREPRRSSPGPLNTQRPQSSRARQNSTQHPADSRVRASSATSNRVNGNTASSSTSNLANVGNKPTTESKNSSKENLLSKNENNGGSNMERSSSTATNRNGDKPKREDLEVVSDNKTRETSLPPPPPPPPQPAAVPSSSAITTTGSSTRGRSSKTSTPVVSTFAESANPRPRRNPDLKRSHKKGAGIAAQAAAMAAKGEDGEDIVEETTGAKNGEEEDEDPDTDEPVYCYCNKVSYGEMVACDNAQCAREWFHLGCVGLERAPPKNAKWYCEECQEDLGMVSRGTYMVKLKHH